MISAEKIRDLLSSSFIQHKLEKLAQKEENGRAMIDNLMAAYAGLQPKKASYIPYNLFISNLPKMLNTDDETLRTEIFSQPFYRRAAANVARSVATFGLHEPQIFTAPILIVWNFTNACNLYCKHCYQNAHEALPDELSLEERLHVIDEMDKNDVATLAISGGEPLMSKDFWPVAKYAADKGIFVSVATNGTLITPDVAARLKEVGVQYVEISVDSANPKKHDEFRGGQGFWEKAVQGIKNCAAIDGMEVGLATTVTQKNFGELQDLIDLSKDLGANYFYAFNFIPAGRGTAIEKDDLTPQMREEMMRILYDNLVNNGVKTFSTCTQYGRYCYNANPDSVMITSHYGSATGQHAKMLCDYIGGCGCGRLYCAMQPNGKITPCVFIPIEVGDIRKNSLSEIWLNSPVMQEMRDRDKLEGNCKTCSNRSMCGGCRARAYGYFNDYLAPDPGCIYNMEAWNQLLENGTV